VVLMSRQTETGSAFTALERATRLGEELAHVGFDWNQPAGPRAKMAEELAELDQAMAGGQRERIEAELGDVLWAAANLARHLHVDPELALTRALDRCEHRFRRVVECLRQRGLDPGQCAIEVLEAEWQEVKRSDLPQEG
jgi:uncharacterized protein YabN with tetrapyrrole methylase and pyrophosphatase domain